MKIYFGASISTDQTMLPVYQAIVKQLEKMGHEVLSKHVVDPETTKGSWQEAYNPAGLFKREADRVDRAEVMVAEVTVPSWGTAFLIEHALENDKPVLALFYKEKEEPLPMMIAGHPELYVQHYDDDNIKTVLQKSLQHFADAKNRKGKLIVIDGGDGSGKATQTKMLLDYLEQNNVPNKYISFPRYKMSFHGKHVGRFLTGEFGGNSEVSPYLSSLAFALDRLTARDEMVEWLKEGNVVVADRYVSANMAHQGSKLKGTKKKELLNWIYSMEYKEHQLPKEDIVIFLYVPVETAQKLLKKTGSKGLANGKDMAEVDLEHQRRSIEMYKELSGKYTHWVLVECVDEARKLLSRQAVHEKILAVLKDKKII